MECLPLTANTARGRHRPSGAKGGQRESEYMAEPTPAEGCAVVTGAQRLKRVVGRVISAPLLPMFVISTA